MKKLITAIVLAGAVTIAGGASAKTAAQCDAEGWAYANQYYNSSEAAAAAALGATFGISVAAISKNNLWVGAWGGALGGLIINAIAQQQRKQRLHDVYYSYCLQGATPQPVYGPPPPPPPPPPPTPQAGMPYSAVITGSGLNIRNAPGVTGTVVIGVLHPGQVFQVVSYSGSWLYIQYNGLNGWVSGSYTQRIQ